MATSENGHQSSPRTARPVAAVPVALQHMRASLLDTL